MSTTKQIAKEQICKPHFKIINELYKDLWAKMLIKINNRDISEKSESTSKTELQRTFGTKFDLTIHMHQKMQSIKIKTLYEDKTFKLIRLSKYFKTKFEKIFRCGKNNYGKLIREVTAALSSYLQRSQT